MYCCTKSTQRVVLLILSAGSLSDVKKQREQQWHREAVVADSQQDLRTELIKLYEGWNFNSGNYLFTTDTK